MKNSKKSCLAKKELEKFSRQKGEFNHKCMEKIWSKAQMLVQPAELEVYEKQCRDADWDMRTALATYENMWQKLSRAKQSAPVLNSLEVPNCIPSACPQVASVLYSIDTETLGWLTETCLWGEVAHD